MREHLFDSTTGRCDHCGVDYFTAFRNHGNWPCEPIRLRNKAVMPDAKPAWPPADMLPPCDCA